MTDAVSSPLPDAVSGPAGHRPVPDSLAAQWFLRASERGNPDSRIDDRGPGEVAWTEGNLVAPLIHGSAYFARLDEEFAGLRAGDRVFFTNWRGDPDERLRANGSAVSDLLCDLARRGVEVRGLLWRSHSDHLSFSAQENQRLGVDLNEAGCEILLDQRVRRFGSHHQKMVVIQHRDDPERDVGFVGGIDIGHGRRDDAQHRGDPQQQTMDRRYRGRAPWHDAALELRGPVIGDLLVCFAERWDDPNPLDRRTPYRRLVQKRARMPRHPQPLPEHFPPPPIAGPHPVQVLRTYGYKRPRYPYARGGERSIARAYRRAFAQARSLIYIEDQYLWSEPVARGIADALARSPELCVIAVVPRFPDADGWFNGPPNRLGQIEALKVLRAAAPERVGVFDLENAEGTPIYVHAKICVVDDTWFACGSANANRRSWTSDGELTCAIADPGSARELRVGLWAEHLGDPDPDPDGETAVAALARWNAAATGLDDWHAGGRTGARPPGRVRHHHPDPVRSWQRLWGTPLYATIFDPDGRPRRLRRRGVF